MKTYILLAAAVLMILVNCKGRKNARTVLEYQLSPSEGNADGMALPLQAGGRIDIGAMDLTLGHPGSRATKTLTCGDKNKCKFEISVGTRLSGNNTQFVDKEKVQVTFTWGNNESSTGTYGTDESYPKVVELPTCGPVTLTINMTEGDTPGLKSKAAVGPVVYWCE